ncbi:MAG TPA: thioredoxin family protein [Cyclobacteriaceae bacterium]|nr:thioredoxin family protein [Cyclobacteriaceae bacterium]
MSNFTFTPIASEEFNDKVIRRNINAVLKITTNWSGASHIVSPLIDELAQQFAGKIEFYVVDFDNDPNVRRYYEVNIFPTLLFFRQGVLVDQLSGVFHKSILNERLQSIIR